MNVLPPPPFVANQSAGYLGYYCRQHLPVTFDLVNLDGTWPAIWLGWKGTTRTFRLFEEKLEGQSVHPSQWRVFCRFLELIALGVNSGVYHDQSGVFVIYDAQQLEKPEFPIRIARVISHGKSKERSFTREQFDEWLTG